MSIQSNLFLNEIVVWTGKPQLISYFNSMLLWFFRIIFLIAFIWCTILGFAWANKFKDDLSGYILITALIIISLLLYLLGKVFEYRNESYIVTDQRVIIQNGVLDKKIQTIDKSKIKYVNVSRTKTDHKFNTGTVLINIGEYKDSENGPEKIFYSIKSVKNFNDVLRFL